jgi:hypothetical protein
MRRYPLKSVHRSGKVNVNTRTCEQDMVSDIVPHSDLRIVVSDENRGRLYRCNISPPESTSRVEPIDRHQMTP